MSETHQISGSEIGRYRVISLLGQGGMGEVYEALDTQLGRRVALKVLPSSATSDTRRLNRFIQEARAASALNHPHLVSIYEIGHESAGGRDVHFIAMEKIDGLTLRELLAKDRPPLRRSIEWILQVIDAVGAAHGAGVVHRDLKPENIMITSTGYAKVLDFGLAKLQPDTALETDPSGSTLAALTATGMVVGTAGYMSPEQARGAPVDHRSDIFALGCILYEAASGQRAFNAGSSIDTLHMIIHGEPTPLRDLVPDAPAELQRIVKKALAKDTEARYQSAKEMAGDLRALLQEREPEKPRSRRTIALAVAVVIVLLAIAAGFLKHRQSPAEPVVRMERLTVRGNVTEAAISPDGKFMAYVIWTERGQSLMLRQLASGQELELVPPSVDLSSLDAGFWGHTFTPDGSAIFFGVKRPNEPAGGLYRISTLGGRPEHILDGIDSSVSFSPDGKRIAYLRADFPHRNESALMVAGADGTGAHAVAIRRPPEKFSPLFFAAPSWAADGRTIATASVRNSRPASAKVVGVDPDNGSETILADGGWEFVGQVAWLPKGDGLVVIAGEVVEQYPATQIWLVPTPKGTPRQLTHDVDQYRIVSLTADGKALVSVSFQRTSSIWNVPLGRPDALERATTGSFDGFKAVSFLPDGRLVFSSLEGNTTQLALADLKRGTRTRVTRDKYSNEFAAAFRNRIAYVSVTPDGNEVCVTNAEGEGREVIVKDVDQAEIAVSPDGSTLVYSEQHRLWKMPMAGGRATALIDTPAMGPSFSPTGDRIAFYYGDQNARRLGIVPARGGAITWSVPATFYTPTIRWLPDGLLVTGHGTEFSNIWKQPFDGESTRVTHLREQYAMDFDISPDGKTLALARGNVLRDAVLLTGFQ